MPTKRKFSLGFSANAADFFPCLEYTLYDAPRNNLSYYCIKSIFIALCFCVLSINSNKLHYAIFNVSNFSDFLVGIFLRLVLCTETYGLHSWSAQEVNVSDIIIIALPSGMQLYYFVRRNDIIFLLD